MAQSDRTFLNVVPERQDDFEAEGVAPRSAPAVPVSILLAEARQRAGYSLRDVAATLRIRLVFLEAIEAGRFDELPGVVYAVGFVRTYAEFVGLDGDEMVRRFKDEVSGAAERTELVFPEPAREGRVPGGAVVLIAVLLAGLAYGGWYYASSSGRDLGDLVPVLPDRFAEMIGTGAGPTAADPQPPAAAPAGPGVPASAPIVAAEVAPDPDRQPVPPSQALAGPAPDPAVPAAGPLTAAAPATVAAADPPAEPPPIALPAEPAPVEVAAADPAEPVEEAGRVVIRATGMSWVQIRAPDGSLVMTRVLQAGDSYEVPPTDGLLLDTGNAGGLEILVDGEPIEPVGRSGEVVRRISLDIGALRGGTAVPD